MSDLKVYPFCGSQPKDCYGYDYHRVRCSNDSCIMSHVAIGKESWNKQQRITELEAQLKDRDEYISQFPNGAVHNGKCQLERLVNDYDFQSEAGSIGMCVDYQGLEMSFNALDNYASLAPQPPKGE